MDNIKDPLFRFFEREINHGTQLLSEVRADLQQVNQICLSNSTFLLLTF